MYKKYLKYKNKYLNLKTINGGAAASKVVVNHDENLKIYHGVYNEKEFNSVIDTLINKTFKLKSATILGNNELVYHPIGLLFNLNVSDLCDGIFCMNDCGTGFDKHNKNDCKDIVPQHARAMFKDYNEFKKNQRPLSNLGNHRINCKISRVRDYNEVIIKKASIDNIDSLIFTQLEETGVPIMNNIMNEKLKLLVFMQNQIYIKSNKIIKIVEYNAINNTFDIITDKLVPREIIEQLKDTEPEDNYKPYEINIKPLNIKILLYYLSLDPYFEYIYDIVQNGINKPSLEEQVVINAFIRELKEKNSYIVHDTQVVKDFRKLCKEQLIDVVP
jgi:hypothetical protein